MDQSDIETVLTQPESPVERLRSLVAELATALSNALHDDRDSAEDSLSRAAAMLQSVEPQTSEAHGLKGGLAPSQMCKVTAHIESNLGKSLRSSDLAKLVGLSSRHFSRAFRISFACSPSDYVARRRIEHAQGLMLSTDEPLAQIALDCGLPDQSHFSRLFRTVVGESPAVWRRARSNLLPQRRSVA